MSLLLDALKRAEQEKRARQGEQQSAADAIPPPSETPKAPPAPKASALMELESVAAPPPPPVTPRATRDREAAQAVFAAKEPGRSKSTNAIIAFGVVALLVLAGGGGWLWYELNRTTAFVARAPIAAPRPVTPAPLVPEPPKTESATPATDLPATAPPIAPPANAAPIARVQPTDAERTVTALLNDSASTPPTPLRLSRTLDAPRVLPELSQGYEALRRGDLVLARSRYEAALAIDTLSLDAVLGLATIAARTGDRPGAAAHYRRVLELDSKNAAALAGLASLSDYSRPEDLEAQMRADLTRYPRSSALYFALGNLYSAQSRWTDAQAAFFEAHRFAPDDADIAYNLAVSLDHLGQSRSASDYYQRALADGRGQATQFDRGQVQRRLAELKP